MESEDLNHGGKTLIQCINLLEDELCHDVKNYMNKHDILTSTTRDTIKERILRVDDLLDQIWEGEFTIQGLYDHFEGFYRWLSFVNHQTGVTKPKKFSSFDLLKSSLKVYNYIYNGGYSCLFDFSDEEKDQQQDQKVQEKEVVK